LRSENDSEKRCCDEYRRSSHNHVDEAVDVQSITKAHGRETRLASYGRQSKNLGKNREFLERLRFRGATPDALERQASLAEKFALQLFA